MESNFTLDFPTLLIGVVVIALLYLLKAGILPWLAAKENLAYREVARLDTHFATTDGVLESTIQGSLEHLKFDASSPLIVAIMPLATEVLKIVHKTLPDTPERIPEEVVASVFNQVIDGVKRVTDNIEGNVLHPPTG